MRYYNSMDFTSPYLKHHGIVGMKWGIRRYTNYDGTLTPEGIKRYGTYENLYKAYTQNKQGKKSNRQINLEKKYRESGKVTKTEAEVMAIGKRQMEQRVLIGSTATAAAAVAISKKRHYDAYGKDLVMKNGQFKRVDADYNRLDNRPTKPNLMYARASYKGKDPDRAQYAGFLAKNRYDNGFTNMQEHTYNAKGTTKVAGSRNAKKVYKSMLKNNPEFRKEMKFGGAKPASYEQFNLLMMNNTVNEGKGMDMYAKEMRKRGYSGVRDLNDAKHSGYGAKTASILFLNNSNLKEVNTRSIKDDPELSRLAEAGKQNMIKNAYKESANSIVIQTAGLIGGGTAAKMALGSRSTAKRDARNAERERASQARAAQNLHNRGYSYAQIARLMGIPEGSVSSLLKE